MTIQLPWDSLRIVGCAQNVATRLPCVIENIEGLRNLFDNSEVLILENDSDDLTSSELSNYAKTSSGVHAFSLPGLSQKIPVKTERLAHLRNACIAWLRQSGVLRASSLVLILDLDEVNSEPWDFEAFQEALRWFFSKQAAAALFASQKGPYYDLWALRHSDLCPDDIWEKQFEAHLRNPELNDQQLFEDVVLPIQFSIPNDSQPFAVESAFGGLAFYKGDRLLSNPATYVGSKSRWVTGDNGPRLIRWQCSEHVSFNAGLRAKGFELFVHPRLINWHTDLLSQGLRLNPGSWRHLQF